ncbi:MAG: tripartite tricarboxylate transporter substrate binding protein [Betaproteobacteria bacterium]|nr:tripartite tricarboxylate transporter substrate binding protein [Betaproteobacteria bacterium]
MSLISRCAVAAALALAAAFAGPVLAQGAYPNKPIRFIVPFPPGGGTDILARRVTTMMTDTLGWSVVVDNRPGAGGTLGIGLAAKASPDGYTLVIGQTSNLAIGPGLYGKLPYDALKDFTPITLISAVPIVLTVGAKSPYASLGDYIKAAKAKPEEVNYASSGIGTVGHLSIELLQQLAGIKFIHVPYKGAAVAIPDLVAGRVAAFVSSLETAAPHVKAGTQRALAVTSLKRSPTLPDVPTVAEAGYPGFSTVTWFGVLVPAKTPEAIVARLSKEVVKILRTPKVRESMLDAGGDVPQGSKAFAAYLKDEHAKWAKIVKESGAKVE